MAKNVMHASCGGGGPSGLEVIQITFLLNKSFPLSNQFPFVSLELYSLFVLEEKPFYITRSTCPLPYEN